MSNLPKTTPVELDMAHVAMMCRVQEERLQLHLETRGNEKAAVCLFARCDQDLINTCPMTFWSSWAATMSKRLLKV